MKDYMKIYQEWLANPYFDEKTKEELRAIANDENEIKERFYMDLEFGTAGLRGTMAVGINRMRHLLKCSVAVLGDKEDVDIIEKYHNQKLDAPSGSALMLAHAVASALPYDAEYVYDRHERREKRPAHEIGISASRGGTIVGEHSVLCCGRDEIIEIKHTALSREVFAVGAVDAAAFMAERTQPGMYDMSDVIASHK